LTPFLVQSYNVRFEFGEILNKESAAMKIRFATMILAAALAVPAAWAQAGGASRAADPPTPGKVGVLNMEVAITSTEEGKQAANELTAKFAPRQTELQNLQKQLQDIQTRIQTTSNTLSDEEKYRLQREYETLSKTAQRKQQEDNQDYQDAQQDLINQLGRKLMTVLDKYSAENGYAVILDESSQQTPIIYAAHAVDVTQDIIKLYDQNYPVKAAAAKPATPGTARPATPKPQPQQQH
jgi:outer membrane protein